MRCVPDLDLLSLPRSTWPTVEQVLESSVNSGCFHFRRKNGSVGLTSATLSHQVAKITLGHLEFAEDLSPLPYNILTFV